MDDAELVGGSECDLKKRASTLMEYRKYLNKSKAAPDDPRRIEVNRKLELMTAGAKTHTNDAHDTIGEALNTAALALQRARDGVEVMADTAASHLYNYPQALPPMLEI